MSARELNLRVEKTARYCVLGTLDRTAEDLWLVCHGFGQLAREFISEFESIANPRRLIVAPEALSRFYKSSGTVHGPDTPVGATWMTREARESEIEDYVRYLDLLAATIREHAAPAARITALGFSQGAATASRWVAAGNTPVDRLVRWGGLLPPEFAKGKSVEALQRVSMSMVMGDSDRYFSENLVSKEMDRLEKLGLSPEVIRFAGGHVIDHETLARLAEGEV
jgi:predicted esterase